MAPELIFSSSDTEDETGLVVGKFELKMNFRERLNRILDEAEETGANMMFIGKIVDFTNEEIKIIYDFKIKVFNGSIYLLAPSMPHQSMVSLVLSIFSQGSNPTFQSRPYTDMPVTIYGKYSCGSVSVKRPDFALRLYKPWGSIPIVAECAFRHEELLDLIVEGAELLTEFTVFQYCICFKIHRCSFFPANFYVFERTVPGGRDLNTIDPATVAAFSHECLEKERAINEELFAHLGISLVLHHEITPDNIDQDFSFELQASHFGLEEETITFTVSGDSVTMLKEDFDAYIALFPCRRNE